MTFFFDIYEPKQRLISAADFRDRLVHHALINVIGPLFERRFIFDCYANRVGKGTHAGIRRFAAVPATGEICVEARSVAILSPPSQILL